MYPLGPSVGNMIEWGTRKKQRNDGKKNRVFDASAVTA
jgi:hypothetical protein